jgi:hypothetical protein
MSESLDVEGRTSTASSAALPPAMCLDEAARPGTPAGPNTSAPCRCATRRCTRHSLAQQCRLGLMRQFLSVQFWREVADVRLPRPTRV